MRGVMQEQQLPKGRSKGRKRQTTEQRSELQKFREGMPKAPSDSDNKVYKQHTLLSRSCNGMVG